MANPVPTCWNVPGSPNVYCCAIPGDALPHCNGGVKSPTIVHTMANGTRLTGVAPRQMADGSNCWFTDNGSHHCCIQPGQMHPTCLPLASSPVLSPPPRVGLRMRAKRPILRGLLARIRGY